MADPGMLINACRKRDAARAPAVQSIAWTELLFFPRASDVVFGWGLIVGVATTAHHGCADAGCHNYAHAPFLNFATRQQHGYRIALND